MPFSRQHTYRGAPPAILIGADDDGRFYIVDVNDAGELLANISDRALRDLGIVDLGQAIPGAEDFAHNQVTVDNAAPTVIVGARAGRKYVEIVLHQDVAVYIGGSGVTDANGQLMVGIAGTSKVLHTQAAVYGRCAAGTTCVVSYMEHFDS